MIRSKFEVSSSFWPTLYNETPYWTLQATRLCPAWRHLLFVCWGGGTRGQHPPSSCTTFYIIFFFVLREWSYIVKWIYLNPLLLALLHHPSLSLSTLLLYVAIVPTHKILTWSFHIVVATVGSPGLYLARAAAPLMIDAGGQPLLVSGRNECRLCGYSFVCYIFDLVVLHGSGFTL